MIDLHKILSGNPDIYDALVDHLDIDLVEHDTMRKLRDAIQFETHSNNSIMETYDDESPEWYCANNKTAMLAMVKGFLDAIDYMQSPEAEMDDFNNFIWEHANDYYEPIAGKPLSIELMKMFIGLDIRNEDDLSDEDGEFDELEYESFSEALQTWEAINQRAEMEDSIR